MKPIVTALALLLAASPAYAQSHSNRDSSQTGAVNLANSSDNNTIANAQGGAGGIGFGGAAQGGSVGNVAGGSVNTSLIFGHAKRSAASAIAPDLYASANTCKGSAGGAFQTAGMGISFGTTTDDEHCEMHKDVLLLMSMEEIAGKSTEPAVVARMCHSAKLSESLLAAGIRCADYRPKEPVRIVHAEPIGEPTERECWARYRGEMLDWGRFAAVCRPLMGL